MATNEKFIWVIGNTKRKKGKLREGQMAIHEVNKRHPFDELAGENRCLVVAGDPPKQVGLTALVAEKIRNGELIQINSTAEAKRLGGVPVGPQPVQKKDAKPSKADEDDEEGDLMNSDEEDEDGEPSEDDDEE